MRKVRAFHCTGTCAKELVLATLSLRFAPILVREPCGRFAALLISTERHSIRQWKEALQAEGVSLLSHAVFGRGCAKQMVQAVQELSAQHERIHKTPAPRHFGDSLLYLDKSSKRLTLQPAMSTVLEAELGDRALTMSTRDFAEF